MAGPNFVNYMGPVLRALDELGGSGRRQEVQDRVADSMGLDAAIQNELTAKGYSRYAVQVNFARFYLARAGYIDSSTRGVWTLTEEGRRHVAMQAMEALELFKRVHATLPKGTRRPDAIEPRADDVPPASPELDPSTAEAGYRELLLQRVMSLSPGGFERFCQRLLREVGFQDVRVTGKSGDGGIDGIGVLEVISLVSFKVIFQCKRYSGSVSSPQVRDFRGAMQGRADKGVIITTGTFTADARKEATREGVPPIELVDGDKLVQMCEANSLGLREVRTFAIDERFFDQFEA